MVMERFLYIVRRWFIQNKWFVGGVALALIFFSFLFFAKGEVGELPQSFWDARKEASIVSQEIRDFTRQTNDAIAGIDLSEDAVIEAKTTELISQARETNTQAYRKAFLLSQNLQKMAESLHLIESRVLQQEAYQAVAVELSLVSEFINYTQYLNAFLDGLEKTMKSRSPEDKQLVDQVRRDINRKVETINDLNEEFLDLMDGFDQNL